MVCICLIVFILHVLKFHSCTFIYYAAEQHDNQNKRKSLAIDDTSNVNVLPFKKINHAAKHQQCTSAAKGDPFLSCSSTNINILGDQQPADNRITSALVRIPGT